MKQLIAFLSPFTTNNAVTVPVTAFDSQTARTTVTIKIAEVTIDLSKVLKKEGEVYQLPEGVEVGGKLVLVIDKKVVKAYSVKEYKKLVTEDFNTASTTHSTPNCSIERF